MTDVLIVGGGSAGSVLAERLSADASRSVTVVEGGPDLPMRTSDAGVLPIGTDSPVVRRYRGTLTGHPVRTADLVRGRCLGGSGAVNGGYFCRALPRDIAALPGWSWEEAVEHYAAVEEVIGLTAATDWAASTLAFLDAAQRAGFTPLDHLADDGTGVATVPLNMRDGIRRGPGIVFLEPACARPNVTVLTDTAATGVRIVAGRAVGIDAVGPDGPVSLDADTVVLCAGAIGTAHLLMLSGIGPAGDLTARGIPVVADLPVGQRCWDHPEWLLSTPWTGVDGRPVLEAVLVTDRIEFRPYTTGFGSATTSIGVTLMQPRARGRVSLTDIEERYDSEPADIADLREGWGVATAMLGIGGEPQWSTSQHLSGTAPMGAVTDTRCRVLGVERLAVVDGSVLAQPLSRGPHATIAMLAHRAAEFF